jgi:hypothetical protein
MWLCHLETPSPAKSASRHLAFDKSHMTITPVYQAEYPARDENNVLRESLKQLGGEQRPLRASPTVLVGVQSGGCSNGFALSTAAP